MIISGKNGTEYRVQWKRAGWSYAVPVVSEKRYFLFFRWWQGVWEGIPRGATQAEKMLPDEMMNWFKHAVEQYERYQEAWSKHK